MLSLAAIFIGFGSGVVVAGAVFAFITVVGVVPRLAQKTKTQNFCRFYESAIALGGIFGTIAGLMQMRLPFGAVGAIVFSLLLGIFYGCLAMSLAEVLNVIPILTRRGNVRRGVYIFVLAIALGKMVGSLLYFFVPGFYDPSSF